MTNVTIDTTAPPPPVDAPAPVPTDQLIREYWDAVHFTEFWQSKAKALKMQLADRLCQTETDGYKNKTLDLGSHKLELVVKRDLKVAQSDPEFLKWWQTASVAEKNLLLKPVPSTLKPSMSGYNALPDASKNAIASAIEITEAVSIKFTEKKDDR